VLTARLGQLRDWALFTAAALAPAVAVGLLGLRALANEEAGARKRAALELSAAAERAAREIEQGVARAGRELGALAIDADPGRAGAALGRVAPRFASPVLLSPERAFLVPEPAAATRRASAAGGPALGPADCRERAAVLALPRPREDEKAAAARRELLAGCPEVTSPSGRFLWPVVALDDAARGIVDDRTIADWIEEHAALLSEPEREAARLDAERVLGGEARERAARALSTSWSRRDALAADLAAPGAAAALRGPPDPSGLMSWKAGASAGTLRRCEDGRLAGFVIDKDALEEALASGAIPLPLGVRAQVVVGPGHGGAPASEGRLAAVAPVASELSLRVVPSDPGAVARLASRSRRILAGLGGFATLAAFGLAALLFARMRAARRSSALRTDFVAAVSHELRTPIASMRMLAELLEEGRVEPEEQGEVFEALAREARRLGETVDRLLGFSRMAAGRYVIERAEASLGRVAAASVDTFEERHPELPRVERALDEEVVADVDAGQIRLALDNLLANAVKYAPKGTPYRVSVAREGGGVALTVKDHGPGVARRDQARIFEPFERADDRLSRATEGSGIGLSLVQHVARAHGGRARVQSEPGGGAAFTIWIPCHDAGARSEP
jgi:two-component system phosphate regulon sensor histidine kinase PhoR